MADQTRFTAALLNLPVIKKLVGDQFFDAMAGHYVRAYPPSSPLIMFYGAGFAEFLEGFEPARQLPYLPDMARLEHARRVAFHASDDPVAGADALARIAPEKLGHARFKLHASVQIVTSDHPIYGIWRFNARDDQTPIKAGAEDVLICRPFGEVNLQKLPAGGAEFLTALREDKSLEEAAELATQASDAFDLSQNIGGLLSAQILSTIEEQ